MPFAPARQFPVSGRDRRKPLRPVPRPGVCPTAWHLLPRCLRSQRAERGWAIQVPNGSGARQLVRGRHVQLVVMSPNPALPSLCACRIPPAPVSRPCRLPLPGCHHHCPDRVEGPSGGASASLRRCDSTPPRRSEAGRRIRPPSRAGPSARPLSTLRPPRSAGRASGPGPGTARRRHDRSRAGPLRVPRRVRCPTVDGPMQAEHPRMRPAARYPGSRVARAGARPAC